MKKLSKGYSPKELLEFKQNQPEGTWNDFRNERAYYSEVLNQLIRDQSGLCAYCEIDLKDGHGIGLSDSRVEHFHPKSLLLDGESVHLEWTNLLASCHGGSARGVVDSAERFSAPDLSCDAYKEDDDLTDIILNPLKIPAFPRLFDCSRATGRLSISNEVKDKPEYDQLIAQAEASIERLNLNADRLTRLRKAALDKLNSDLRFELTTQNIDEVMPKLITSRLSKNKAGVWMPFFTSIWSYFGASATRHLHSIKYQG